jgi:hypothetical protein
MITHYAITAALDAQRRDQIAADVAASRHDTPRVQSRPLTDRLLFRRPRAELGQPHTATA